MIKIDNKTLRNLEEQVLENKEQIALHWNVDRVLADFGIKVLGRLDSKEVLDEVPTEDLQYGDAYLIGTVEPYDVWIWTRADVNAGQPEPYWLDIGHIAIEGPTGPQGPKGEQGKDGMSTHWFIRSSLPGASVPTYNLGDIVLLNTNGTVYQLTESSNGRMWALSGSIRGPQGIQGIQGPQGEQGPQGPQGPIGDKGDVGGFINIWGILGNVEQLPLPATLDNLTVAYLIGAAAPYDLYIQVGESSDTATWTNTGPFNAATLVTVNGSYQNIWNADTKLDRYTNVTEYNQVYVKAADGSEGTINVTKKPIADSVVQRQSDGNIYVAFEPVEEIDATSKYYVDTNFTPKPDVGNSVPFFDSALNPGKILINQNTDGTTAPQAYRFGRYMESGELPVGTPTQPYYAANKKYVDDNFVAKMTDNTYGLRAYVNNLGGDSFLNVTDQVAGHALPRRTANGGLLVPTTPDSQNAAVNKAYVEDNFVKQVEYTDTRGESGTDGQYHARVYGVKYDGTETTIPVGNQSNPYSICWRDSHSNIYVGLPQFGPHCVNLTYFNENKGTKLYKHEITISDGARTVTFDTYTLSATAYNKSTFATIAEDYLIAKYGTSHISFMNIDGNLFEFKYETLTGSLDTTITINEDFTLSDTVTAL